MADVCNNINQIIIDYQKRYKSYSVQTTNYQKFDADYKAWKNKNGSYETYQKYGKDESFKIHWGGSGGNASEDCKGCAKRKLENGWWNKNGRMAKNIGWAGQDQICELSPDENNPLVGWESYEDRGTEWGWDVWLSRKWWRCNKSTTQITLENSLYESVKPIPSTYYTLPLNNLDPDVTQTSINEFSFSYDTPPTPPSLPNINTVCCGITINNASITNGDLTVSDLNQACNLSIPLTTSLSTSTSTSTSTPTTTTENVIVTPPTDNTLTIIISVVVALVVVALIGLSGYGVYKEYLQ